MHPRVLALCCALGFVTAAAETLASSGPPSNLGQPVTQASAALAPTVGHAVADGAECGRPQTAGAEPAASDALYVLLAGVGVETCPACVCDVDDSASITATDALRVLGSAVGQPVTLSCPACESSSSGLFEAPNPWNRVVDTLPVSAESAQIIAALENAGGWGTGSFRIDFSIHLLDADAATPRATFGELPDYYHPDCDDPFPFPVPVGGAIEGHDDYTCNPYSEDCHLLVVDRDAKLLYELYGADMTGGDLIGRCAVIWDLTKAYPDELRGEQCTSADAAGLPIAGLLFTADEVAAGEIPHAIRFILPNERMRAGVYVHPATHAGAPSGNSSLPPYGVRFRLRADYPIDSIADVNARVIARALQKYGMILSDGGNIALTGASDRYAMHTWPELGIDSHSLDDIQVGDFEVLEFETPIPITYDCQRID